MKGSRPLREPRSRALDGVRMPNLFILGAAKSGTSSLHELLDQHPDIHMSSPKEPHVFSNPTAWARRDSHLRSLWDGDEGSTYLGESSTSYLVSDVALGRIDDLCVEPKFIVILRNPIDRILSHHRWLLGQGQEHRSLLDAVSEEDEKFFDPTHDIFGNYYHYLGYSRYGAAVARFLEVFSADQLHVIPFNQLKHSPTAAVRTAFEFLGVDATVEVEPVHANQSKQKTYSKLSVLIRKYDWSLRRRVLDAGLQRSVFGRGTRKLFKAAARAAQRIGPMAPEASYSNAERTRLRELLSSDVALLRKLTGERFEAWDRDFPPDGE